MFPVSIAHIDTESAELREEMMMSTSTYACLSAMPPVSIYRQHPPSTDSILHLLHVI